MQGKDIEGVVSTARNTLYMVRTISAEVSKESCSCRSPNEVSTRNKAKKDRRIKKKALQRVRLYLIYIYMCNLDVALAVRQRRMKLSPAHFLFKICYLLANVYPTGRLTSTTRLNLNVPSFFGLICTPNILGSMGWSS